MYMYTKERKTDLVLRVVLEDVVRNLLGRRVPVPLRVLQALSF